MSVTDDYLANNRAYAATFTGPLPLPPSKHIAVVACMDARLDPAEQLEDPLDRFDEVALLGLGRVLQQSLDARADAGD